MRVRERGKPRSPKIGYSSPKIVRGFHPCGKPEILVHNVSDLENSEEKVYRIASSVGTRKKIEILHHAIEKNIKILNPSIKFLKVSSVEDLEKNSKIITYVKDVLISEKVSDDVREEILKKAQEMGIEVE